MIVEPHLRCTPSGPTLTQLRQSYCVGPTVIACTWWHRIRVFVSGALQASLDNFSTLYLHAGHRSAEPPLTLSKLCRIADSHEQDTQVKNGAALLRACGGSKRWCKGRV